MQKQIFHISQDEKFIELTKHQFNGIYGEFNTYYIVVKDKSKHLHYVKKDSQTKVIPRGELINLAEDLPRNSVVVFHSLVSHFYNFIDVLRDNHTLIWVFFGMEIYNDEKFYNRKKSYAPLTNQLLPTQKISIKKKLKTKLRPLVRQFKPTLPFNGLERRKELFKVKRKVINAFDYIGLLYKEDFEYITTLAKIKDTQQLFYTYYPLEKIVNITDGIVRDKTKIMIGNSGYPTSNHLDVFKKISQYELKGYEILLPLNYGAPDYIHKIKEKAEEIFSDKIDCLTDFLSLEEYNKILKEVGIFILYTRRQQGVGNVIALLWHGAKVYLSKENTFYHYLKRIGIIVFCYEYDLNEDGIKQNLSIDEISHNRTILLENLNEEYLSRQLKRQFDLILES